MRMPDVKNNFDGIKVACVGDSLTYGTTLLTEESNAIRRDLQDFSVLNTTCLILDFQGMRSINEAIEVC